MKIVLPAWRLGRRSHSSGPCSGTLSHNPFRSWAWPLGFGKFSSEILMRPLIYRRYGGRLISFGEYTTTQFFIVFIGVIFSGEAAAQFFSYTTSLTKSATAVNYILWLRRLKPAVEEDTSKPPFDEGNEKVPAHIEVKDVAFAYESRPNAKVLNEINVDVSGFQRFTQTRLNIFRSNQENLLHLSAHQAAANPL